MLDASKFMRFILVGGTTAIVQLFLTWKFVDGFHWQVIFGSTIAFILAGAYNYSLHYFWTFSSDVPHGWVLIRYLLMCLGAMILNGIVMHFGVTLFAVHYLVVQIFAAATVVTWSFIISSLWVFTRKG